VAPLEAIDVRPKNLETGKLSLEIMQGFLNSFLKMKEFIPLDEYFYASSN
jgi:hypothetical protein